MPEKGTESLIAAPPQKCGCKFVCGDVSERNDHPRAVCKGLPTQTKSPLVEIVLVDRRAS